MENLRGKTALFCGDSICEGTGDNAGGGWASRLQRDHGLISRNQAIGGYSLSCIRTGRVVDQLHNAAGGTYDYLILQGGVNDAWGDGTVYAPPGRMTAGFAPQDFDVTTYAGALEELFYYAYRYFPGAVKGYIINFALPLAGGIGHCGDMEPYFSEGEKICRKWGIPALDLYHMPEITHEVLQNDREPLLYMADSIHPAAEGYERLTPYIARWMGELAPSDFMPPLMPEDTGRLIYDFASPKGWEPLYDSRITLNGGLAFDRTGPEQHISGPTYVGAGGICRLPEPLDIAGGRVLEFDYELSAACRQAQLELDLITREEPGLKIWFGLDLQRPGRHRMTWDISRPEVTASVDLHRITALRVVWWNHNMTTDSALQVTVSNLRLK